MSLIQTISFVRDQHEKLCRVADKKRTTKSAIVREALDDYFKLHATELEDERKEGGNQP